MVDSFPLGPTTPKLPKTLPTRSESLAKHFPERLESYTLLRQALNSEKLVEIKKRMIQEIADQLISLTPESLQTVAQIEASLFSAGPLTRSESAPIKIEAIVEQIINLIKEDKIVSLYIKLGTYFYLTLPNFDFESTTESMVQIRR